MDLHSYQDETIPQHTDWITLKNKLIIIIQILTQSGKTDFWRLNGGGASELCMPGVASTPPPRGIMPLGWQQCHLRKTQAM